MWTNQGNSEYASRDGLWLIRPHTNEDGDNIKGDWGLYARIAVRTQNGGVAHWDYVASATTLAALKEMAQ